MQTKTESPPAQGGGSRRTRTPAPNYFNDGLSPKKTAFIIVTVIGCIAILWPKVFYPMMFGGSAQKPNIKEQRGPGGCCDVVFDREQFSNATTATTIGPQLYRKQLNLLTGEMSIRQERPSHLHPESIYQAMRERGRAIPATPTVPIVERKGSLSNPPPRIVDGRPGPIPGMRPPMGAQGAGPRQPKSNSMGFIMPLYTVGIIVFFGYTIMKVIFKKPIANAPYGPVPTDPNFRREVFGQENGHHVEDLNSPKLEFNLHALDPPNGSQLYNASLSAATVASNLSSSLKQHQQQYHPQQQQHQHEYPDAATATETERQKLASKESDQLMEIEKLRKKLEVTERAMAKLIAEMNSDQVEAKKLDEHTNSNDKENITKAPEHMDISDSKIGSDEEIVAAKSSHSNDKNYQDQDRNNSKDAQHQQRRAYRDGSADRSVAVIGMEVTASCENGRKWKKRPPTPVFFSHNEHSKDGDEDDDKPEPQSIYLEGALAHDSKILVADAETKREEIYDEELNGSPEEPAVVISSKMTLSLINLESKLSNDSKHSENEIESPLADDIEIIGHDEK